MSSVRERILEYIRASLIGHTSAGQEVYRSRSSAISRAKSPAIIISPISESTVEEMYPFASHSLTIAMRYIARADIPDSAADVLAVGAHALLMADRSLGGLALDVTEVGTQWQFDDADLDACELTMHYRIAYRTSPETMET